jgi:hypothetical protein
MQVCEQCKSSNSLKQEFSVMLDPNKPLSEQRETLFQGYWEDFYFCEACQDSTRPMEIDPEKPVK